LLLLLAFCFIFLVLWFLFCCCCLFCSFFKKSHQPQSQKNLEEFIPDEAVPFLSVEVLLQLMLRAILALFLLYWSYNITPHPVPLEFVDFLKLLSNSWQRSPAACCEGLGEPSAQQEYLCGGLSGSPLARSGRTPPWRGSGSRQGGCDTRSMCPSPPSPSREAYH